MACVGVSSAAKGEGTRSRPRRDGYESSSTTRTATARAAAKPPGVKPVSASSPPLVPSLSGMRMVHMVASPYSGSKSSPYMALRADASSSCRSRLSSLSVASIAGVRRGMIEALKPGVINNGVEHPPIVSQASLFSRICQKNRKRSHTVSPARWCW